MEDLQGNIHIWVRSDHVLRIQEKYIEKEECSSLLIT